jgi:hypothetical protein
MTKIRLVWGILILCDQDVDKEDISELCEFYSIPFPNRMTLVHTKDGDVLGYPIHQLPSFHGEDVYNITAMQQYEPTWYLF